jgi:ankyrin repeat protein
VSSTVVSLALAGWLGVLPPVAPRAAHDIFDAVAAGDVDQVKALAAAGFDVNAADNAGRTPLRLAVEGNNRRLVDLLLTLTADPNVADKEGVTPLHAAVASQYPDLAFWLLQAGAKADTADVQGLTPLHAALQRSDFDLAAALIDAGAHVDVRDRKGRTLLHHAVLSGPVVTRFVAGLGVNVNAVDKGGATALHRTIEAWDGGSLGEETLLALLKRGADATMKDRAGKTALDLALERHNYPACRVLALPTSRAPADDPLAVWDEGDSQRKRYEKAKKALDAGSSADSEDEHSRPLIVGAAWNGELAIVELLAARKADVNVRDKEGKAALAGAVADGSWLMTKALLDAGAKVDTGDGGAVLLNAAIKKGSLETTRLLLEHEADPKALHAGVTNHWAALLQAIETNDLGMVDLLLEYEADVNAQAGDSSAPAIVYAWRSKHRLLAKRLLQEEGVDVRAADRSGVTLLHLAAGSGDVAVVKRLLARGADLGARGSYPFTPLDEAIRSNRVEVVKVLLDAGAAERDTFRETAAHTAVRAQFPQSPQILELLLRKGADPNARNAEDKTPLIALLEGLETPEMVRVLLKYGARVDACDREHGETALQAAAAFGNVEVTRLLLAAKADVDATNRDGEAALHFACSGGHVKVAGLLLDRHANPNVADKVLGMTPLHVAVLTDNAELLALLLKYQADRKATDVQCQTPLDLARTRGKKDVLALLQR